MNDKDQFHNCDFCARLTKREWRENGEKIRQYECSAPWVVPEHAEAYWDRNGENCLWFKGQEILGDAE